MSTIIKMTEKISIYLAGSIKKGHENPQESFWTNEDMCLLKTYLAEYEVSFLNPAFRTDDLSDQCSVFGRDMTQVFCSDIVFVDARDRRGLGVGAEMMWAKFHKIPVISLSPKNSHYNKENTTLLGKAVHNWVHPFVESLSDALVADLQEGADKIRYFMKGQAKDIKGVEYIRHAMQHYRAKSLPQDDPMQALLAASDKLLRRMTNHQRD